MKAYLEDKGVESAVINLGGNVLCVGERPDGTPFKIGLQRPYATHTETVAALKIDGMSVVSSGVYAIRFFRISYCSSGIVLANVSSWKKMCIRDSN